MIQPGDQVPEATVWRSTKEHVTIRQLAEEGPFLLFFYILDWTST